MPVLAEQLPVFFQGKNIAVGIHSGFIQLILGNQRIAHFVAGIAEHQHHLLSSHSDSAKADCETVPGKDGENNSDSLSSQLLLHILRNRCNGRIISLRSRHNGFRYGDYISVP